MENAKLFVYPKDFKFPRGLRARLMKAGYILVPEDRVGSVRVIEPLPEFDLLSDSGWLLKTLLKIVMADTSYEGGRVKLSKAMMKEIDQRYGTMNEIKAVEKVS